jgi:hypothetical protein
MLNVAISWLPAPRPVPYSNRLFVMTLARPDLLIHRPAWGAGKRNFTSVDLEPLTDAAMRQLLDGLVPGLPDDAVATIIGRADGIPLYAVETVRMLVAERRLKRAAVPPKSTRVAPVSRVPVSVTTVPPRTGPAVVDSAVTAGGAW